MCGIIAIVRRPSERALADPARLVADLERALSGFDAATDAAAIDAVAASLGATDDALVGAGGVKLLLDDQATLTRVRSLAAQISARIPALESRALDDSTPGLEARTRALTAVKDAAWTIERDRLRTVDAVAALAGRSTGWSAVEAYTSIQQALSAIDRLEVRGRDSAGLLVAVRDHRLDPEDPAVKGLLAGRVDDPLLRSGAARLADGQLVLAYKAAAEIGELGDNTAAIRAQIAADELLALALTADRAQALVLGHTRWASVGIISEANAHPLDSHERDGVDRPFVAAALNGDVDNFADLKASHDLDIFSEITTDAKVIPTIVSRRLAAGDSLAEAFRSTVASFEGSVAIAATLTAEPNRLMLALRGSGQALYVGLADDAFVVASEPYGLIEETPRYLRLDGETPANPENPNASRGQIVLLDGTQGGRIEGIERLAYDGTPLPVTAADITTAEITTRDIDRGDAPHFLLKEITEAPRSFAKTLRGRIVGDDPEVVLGDDVLPAGVREDLASGTIRKVVAIGQGTAHMAGHGFVAAFAEIAAGHGIDVRAMLATELSGFGMRADMSDTLVVAVSQSGTTTDTNRTVDLVRSRGARVIAIVNRRGSDLTDKADGVLYTSDGRDVEMSVASTKAFYAQVAAGFVLAAALGAELGEDPDPALLRGLRDLPDAMTDVLATRPRIAEVAQQFAPPKRYWAMVGNGANRIAAEELRIKLSELCYKAIACDGTEDKKHIDLSSEPLILVCAAGLTGSTADDVAKEVAIYKAHKATPIVVATEGEQRFGAATAVLFVPACHPALAFVLATMVGHLFGYEAALAIDASARPLRQIRAVVEGAIARGVTDGEALLHLLRTETEVHVRSFFTGLWAGLYDGHMEASTSVRIANLLRYAAGTFPLEVYQLDHGKIGTPSVLIEDLAAALSTGIDELTRPIDAIKHQAKTVTVGISRTDETLLQVPLVAEVLAAGAPRDQLTYGSLRTLADIDPAVAEVTGYSRYRIEPSDTGELLSVVDRGGIAAEMPTRADRDPHLRGTKRQVAMEQRVLAARGRSDGRTIVIVPEIKNGTTTGITLLHVRFAERLSVAAARGVLAGYRNRLAQLTDAVMETEPTFRDDLLADVPVADLLTLPVAVLADRWRT